jgi:NO-binding membrane sensor protein with MHYT domain
MSDAPRITVRPPGSPSGYREPPLQRARAAFRTWRKARPFWGGLWCVLGGAAMAYGPTTAVKVILISGTVVWAGILVGVLVATMGLFLWFTPHLRHLVGIVAVLLSIVSLLTSDYGGFGIGLVLGTVGGALGFAWTPVRAEPK